MRILRSICVLSQVGLALIALSISACNGGSSSGASVAPPPPPPPAASQGGLIAIDTQDNVGYVPIYTLSSGAPPSLPSDTQRGEAASTPSGQMAAIDLTIGVANPVIAVIPLVGAFQPLGAAYDQSHNRVLVEAADTSGNISVYDISTSTNTLTATIPTPGLTSPGSAAGGEAFCGLLLDASVNQAYVAGSQTLGILHTSTEPPVFDASSVIDLLTFTDSISLNTKTKLLFIAHDGNNEIVDTSQTPLAQSAFSSDFGTTDGSAFDPGTNVMLLTNEEGPDQGIAFNFRTLDLKASPASALNVIVPGLGVVAPVGEGPGGEAVVNNVTHQGVICDEFGQNLWLVQLPKKPFTGAPNNNGQPGSGTGADAKSAYTIAATVIPKGNIGGTPTQLGILGDPNSLTIDPVHNLAYMLADTNPQFHGWLGGTGTDLFLIRIDLSAPVFGATSANPSGPQWNPISAVIPMP